MRPQESSWGSQKLLDGLRGTPWQPVPGTVAETDGAFPTVIYAQPVLHPGAPMPVLAPASRHVYMRRNFDLRKYGYSVGCPGCDAARAGSAQRGHGEACRNRIEESMLTDEASASRVEQSAVKRGAPEPTPSAKRVAWGDMASASGPAHGAEVTASASGPATDADEKVDEEMSAVLFALGVLAYSSTTYLPDVNSCGFLCTVSGLVYDVRGGPELVDETVRAPVVKDLPDT